MALVTSDETITVIILEHEGEVQALTNLLTRLPRLHNVSGAKFSADYPELDELTNAMLGEKMAFAYEEPVTNWDKPEPPWKDEPTSDYRVAE